MNEDKNVRIQLEKHLWPDEVREIKKEKNSKILVALVCAALIFSGFFVGYNISPKKTTVINTESEGDISKLEAVYNILSENWYFASLDIDAQQHLIDNAIQGMATSVEDPHTYYMSGEELENFTTSIDMGFVGIGVQYNSSDDHKIITRVFHNSPAEKAGVLAGDIIYKVDGTLCSGLSSDEIASVVKGPEGTEVVIEFLRDNEIVELTITRAPVQNTAYGEMTSGNIGYLQIYQFGSSTGSEIEGYLEMMTEQGLEQLVIDLRDNGGGYLGALVEVASAFLPEGTVAMKQVYADGTVQASETNKGMFTNIKNIVILVNENTASASEVLVMALKEQRDDVTIIGTTTYGKGTVQITHTFTDGSAIKYTTSKWVSPSDVWINEVGIAPDQEVKLHPIFDETIATMEQTDQFELDSVSSYTKATQNALDFLGYDVDRTDGYFDDSTQLAISKFQAEFGLGNAGVLDSKTYATLIAQVTKRWSLDKDVDTQLQAAYQALR